MTDKAVKKSVKDIVSLTENDVRLAEDVITVLKPLKTVRTFMCTVLSIRIHGPACENDDPENYGRLLSDDDSPAVRDVKTAIRNDLEKRYTDPGPQHYLHSSTALDPRFKSLLDLDASLSL
ncbi:hypothetical protein VZT92_022655 [Zoarces viviparus]|uniref:Uncharacterized protein n=1 Tax=Zoarces viviparus TaxID=48416 RepID=A0AAW1EC10_ZOAVI